jgi:outer membrane protein assembly factor BamB
MKLNFTDKDISILKIVSQISGGFTLIVALTMLFSLIQLKTINPLDNPALLSVKEQFDKDPANAAMAAQVRAMDLMARKAYFSSRWQVETGSYLLLAGALIFILCQRLISDNKKISPVLPGVKQDLLTNQEKSRKYLFAAASVIVVTAIASSFLLRGDLPDPSGQSGVSSSDEGNRSAKVPEPDKTNYPSFRGQDGRGIAGGSGYSLEWNGAEGKNIEWKTEIPKPGQSSPVIWEDNIFLTGAEDNECQVYCIDKKSGKIIWTGMASNIPGEPEVSPETDQDTGLAASTAAVNKKVVCAVFANGNLVCFDHDGKLLWSKNIGLPENSYGYSSSLIIYESLLLVQFDSNEKISLMGFEAETGELKWETIRQGRPVWSSPVIAYFGGKPQLVINGNPNVTSYDVLTGKELWSVECMSGDVAPSLAVNTTMVYSVTDYAKLAAIRGGTGAAIIWEDNTFTPDVSSPVATDNYVFVATGSGDIACYNSEKGDTLWTHYFQDQFYASPIIADEMLYLLDRSGVMHIVNVGPEYKLISEASLGERADCTPAFSDKNIYIRGKKNLYCISKN